MTDPRHYTVLHPSDISGDRLVREAFALDVLVGLSSERKFIPTKYFYDEHGSRLFQQISELPEYYLTRCETQVLERYRTEISDWLSDQAIDLIELGAGDGRKTALLLESFTGAGRDFRYVPIDISEAAIAQLTQLMSERFALRCHGIVAEYFDGLRWLKRNDSGRRKLVLFLGSNIGNFDAKRSGVFLRTLWDALAADDLLLIGFDLKKDIDVMLHAYNDSAGVTSRFNLNVLERINRELAGEFDLSLFQHYGSYNVFSGAMESFLVSTERQSVHVGALNKRFDFRPHEAIHLESSFKFLLEDVLRLATRTGFHTLATFRDDRQYFVDALWRVVKQ